MSAQPLVVINSVHPRTRGEHVRTKATKHASIGSSPHSRGTQSVGHGAGRRQRFIPALAGNTVRVPSLAPKFPVHPRTRGEHLDAAVDAAIHFGSSPHSRGTQTPQCDATPRRRFIPALAGNTSAPAKRRACQAVHPRTRGEHQDAGFDLHVIGGSSPHPRGTRVVEERAHARFRFIPAPAGNTRPRPRPPEAEPVHPRTRGEHCSCSTACAALPGSSPHPRGTHKAPDGVRSPNRFIPAPAGNTGSSRPTRWRRTVHPRTRGEHAGVIKARGVGNGSSPHPRGTRQALQRQTNIARFIPAPAGNTAQGVPILASISVHPRTRGEHGSDDLFVREQHGSSPHPRGTRQNFLQRTKRGRFIPAPAGNTALAPAATIASTVHPRTRGEHAMPAASSSAMRGSSPHPRGTRFRMEYRHCSWRFIPAPAGNTAPASAPAPAVHPRTRGEHMIYVNIRRLTDGSSPHPRGTHRNVNVRRQLLRFIPAPAGNTRRSSAPSTWWPVHPRTRGEH